MPITIGSNIGSLQAQRRLADATSSLSKTFERLSSGQRINRASDDAAGLAISSGLNSSTRVFTQGMRNGSDGLSLLAIADAAVENLSGVVTRMTELAIQSANGVYSSRQRRAIDTEAQSLAKEYLRIARSTEFNGMRLFDGTLGSGLRLQLGFGLNGGISSSVGGAIGTGSFQGRTTQQTGASPASLTLGDLNGDGILDMVTADQGSSTVSVMLGNGDGTFRARTTLQTGTGPSSVTLGDLNGDGVLDIVTADVSSGVASILIGNGDGTFRARTSVATGVNPLAVRLGDLNGDGVLDLVSADYGSNTVSIMLGNGNGTFQSRTTVQTGTNPVDVRLGDLNGDGILDIVTADRGSNSASIIIGNGDGTFRTRTSVSLGTQPQNIMLGDLNGDGVLDIVSGDGGSYGYSNTVSILLGNGNGTFRARTTVQSGFNPMAVSLGDLNGDGILDLVTADNFGNSISSFLGRGDGTFQSRTSVQSGTGPGSVSLGDLNGDGVLDIVASESANTVSAFLAQTQAGIGSLNEFSLRSRADALQALGLLRNASDNLAKQRGVIGSFQSRVGVAISALQSTTENFRAAESRIVDTDVASESANLTRAQILQKAGAAILAQANLQPQLALRLLS